MFLQFYSFDFAFSSQIPATLFSNPKHFNLTFEPTSKAHKTRLMSSLQAEIETLCFVLLIYGFNASFIHVFALCFMRWNL